VLGKVEMSATQVRSAEILLSKSLPSLTAIDLEAQVTENKTISDKPMDVVSWLTQYSQEAEVGNDAEQQEDKLH